MKSILSSKFFLWVTFVVAFVMVLSCNNSSTNKSTEDSTKMMSDSAMAKMSMDTASVPMVSHAEAMLAGTFPDTAVSGTLKFDAQPDGQVKMVLEITVPAKAGKSIAVHIHQDGDCGDMGKMAHGHWNPTNAQHGKWGSASFHSGDIGNVTLNAKGIGTLTLTTDLWTLGGNPDKNILGKAIIVHGGMDDYTTQPTGNAGDRIGCAVIQ